MHFNSNTTNGKSITELYIAAAKRNEILNKRDPAVLMRSVEANQHAFICDRGTFTNLLTHYHGSYRCIVVGILHYIFSTPRSGPGGVPAGSGYVNSVKLDAIHEMLQLPAGSAVLDTNHHPVCLEYEEAPGKGIRPMFPSAGSAAVQVFTKHADPHPETAMFLKALGRFL